MLSPIDFSNCGPGAFYLELLCFFENEIFVYSSPWDTAYCKTLVNYHTYEESASIEMYPNPTKRFLNIDLNNDIIGKIFVYDMLGMIVLTKELAGESIHIDLLGIQNGIYIIHLVMDDGIVVTRVIKN